jgi:hypothetical protein
MTEWRYTNQDRRVVARVHDDGSIESHSIEAPVIADWLAAGGVPDEPPPERRMIAKAVILERLSDQQLTQALSLMTARENERWRMPGAVHIYVDDPELLTILTAIGADTKAVLAA